MDSIVSWVTSAVIFGTVMMYGALGEILTEKSGHLNLGVPGLMFLGGFAGFASAFLYEKSGPEPNPVLMAILPLACGFTAAALGGLLYSFFTVTLRANQNVTGLALTFFGVGVGGFSGVYILLKAGYKSYAKAALTYEVFSKNLNSLYNLGPVGEMLLSYGFMTYAAIALAIFLHFFLKKTRVGLNLRAIGENPATADAAGVNVTFYKYLSTTIGGGISGLGGLFYFLVFCNGGWMTNNKIEALGWLAIALVIFATWKPVNVIWGSYLFAMLFWLYNYFPDITGITFKNWQTDLVQTIPYIFTILVLIIISFRKKKENQPPASLGLSYFREER
jgi:simple sugar transport system permease protein